MKVWTPEQLRAFLESVMHDRIYAAWHLLATTGMRRGEVLGLRWLDAALDAGRLSVVQALGVIRRQLVFSEPKTAKGRRAIALD